MANTAWLLKVLDKNSSKDHNDLADTLSADLDQAWIQVAEAMGLPVQELAMQVANHFGLDAYSEDKTDKSVARFIPQRLAKQKFIAPIKLDGDVLLVATSDPLDDDAVKQARFTSGKAVKFLVTTPAQITHMLGELYAGEISRKLSAHIKLTDDGQPASNSEMQRNPVVVLARKLIFKAVMEGASDIHIQPYLDGGQIRFRNQGILHPVSTLPLDVMERVVRYFMAMTGMDISQQFLPQDGSATLYIGERRIDMRISTLPNRGGERLVIRLLDQSQSFGLDNLAFSPRDTRLINQMASHRSGMILFTGPTGSGKTTSLYSILMGLNDDATNIITVENPVEYQLPGLSQVDIDPNRGLTFENSLRSILRQDPDVLLVGEIRDEETAEIATRAALTGHLLFSTLHTMDACNAIPRLLDLGITQPVLGETLLGIVSQRLLRKLCESCAEVVVEPLNDAEALFKEINDSPPKLRAVGCSHCRDSGYNGRAPIVEILEMNSRLRSTLINNTFNLNELSDMLSSSYQRMSASARDLVYSGITTAEEVQRVLGYPFWEEIAQDAGRDLDFDISRFGQNKAKSSGRGSILLVHQKDSQSGSTSALLEANDYQVLQAEDLKQARKVVASHTDIQLIVLDVPKTSREPIELLTALRSELAWAGLPCVFLLPEGDETMNQVLHTHFMDDFIKKPVSDEELINLVKGVISR